MTEMVMNRMWGEVFMGCFKHYLNICLERLNKSTKNDRTACLWAENEIQYSPNTKEL